MPTCIRWSIFQLVSDRDYVECYRAGIDDRNQVTVMQVKPTSAETLTSAPLAKAEFDKHLKDTHRQVGFHITQEDAWACTNSQFVQ